MLEKEAEENLFYFSYQSVPNFLRSLESAEMSGIHSDDSNHLKLFSSKEKKGKYLNWEFGQTLTN